MPSISLNPLLSIKYLIIHKLWIGGDSLKFDIFDWIALILVIVGALNWGLVGLLGFDLVATLFGGSNAFLSKAIYSLIGLSGAYMLYLLTKLKRA